MNQPESSETNPDRPPGVGCSDWLGFAMNSIDSLDCAGPWFGHTIHCPDCGHDNGMRLSGGTDYPPLPERPHIGCVWCGQPNTIYKLVWSMHQ